MTSLQDAGLSHSEIRGSQDICSFPRLIAAYRVLLRLREPRHPPCALSYFLLYRLSSSPCGSTTLILSAVFQVSTSLMSVCTDTDERRLSKLSTVLLVSICQRSFGICRNPSVENNGFEPLTSCMPCKRSSQLS